MKLWSVERLKAIVLNTNKNRPHFVNNFSGNGYTLPPNDRKLSNML